MQIALHNPVRKTVFLGTCLLLCTTYVSFCSREFLAAYFSEKPQLASLQRAIFLEPANAAYWHLLGRYHLFVQQEPQAALPFLRSAVALNPHRASYWLDLATGYQLLGNKDEQSSAMAKAVMAEPTTPDIAWQAANLYWVQGKPEKASKEFRVVAENDPYLARAAIERCWQIRPNAEALLKTVLPRRADVYSLFLEILISKNEASSAAQVWAEIARLQAPVSTRYVFDYVRYLNEHKQIEQASRVWSDAGKLAQLAAYQPSPVNLLVNGDFSLPILNGGFDWMYQSVPGVSLALDPTESHSGHRSLSIVFDGAGMQDAGIQQRIPVEPNTAYEFSAYFKSENLEGAGGPVFVLQDGFSNDTYFTSDELKGADFWKQVGGTFNTGTDTRLLLLRVAHMPAANAIRGRLWIDGVRLAEQTRHQGAE
jgi:tetratricopeptide (TPR) repeat protein